MKADAPESFYVLLVENDPVVSDLFKRSLESDRKYPYFVDQAFSVEEALQKTSKNFYDLLLTEYDIEAQTGPYLIQQIRAKGDQDLPCIVMSSFLEDNMRETAFNSGAVDLIIKDQNSIQDLMKNLRENYRDPKTKKVNCQDRRSLSKRMNFIVDPESVRVPASIQDELTGLYNHSYLHERILLEYSRTNRYQHPMSCLVLDIDHFKTINEQYGYKGGDKLLKKSARLLFENCRLSDVVARNAGEEFVVLLPNSDYAAAEQLAQRLQKLFDEHVFDIQDTKLNLTVSIGISSYPEDKAEQSSEVVEFASQALFRSKASGRNCVTRYSDIVPTFGEDLPDLKVSEGKILEFQRKMTEISNVARKAYTDASRTLIMMLESKDKHTAGHSASCAKLSMQVAQTMGLSVEEAEIVQHGALLHDIGKICIPDKILLKPGKLTFQEYEAIKQHAYLGYKIIKPIQFLQQEALITLHHHEWWNGEGYPCKLKGNEIPLGARIVAVVDTYDTIRMAGGRYKKTTTVANAVKELIAYSGLQFDPHVVEAFIEVLKIRGELQEEEVDRAKLDEALQAAAPK